MSENHWRTGVGHKMPTNSKSSKKWLNLTENIQKFIELLTLSFKNMILHGGHKNIYC